MNRRDIIVAPATPPGDGGVAIIRLSGQSSLSTVKPLFRPSSKTTEFLSHQLYHGSFHDLSGTKVDEVLFVYMEAPRTFTAEEVVEIHCHGGQQTVSLVLHACTAAGARLARPGEFSYRAFLNGRIDLSQAEAIADLIHSRSSAAQSLALAQLDGQVSQALYKHTELLRNSLALVEAWLDFPEEELPVQDIRVLRNQVSDTLGDLKRVCDSYNTGRLYSEGVSLLLLGRPNVGKSSLMNALLGEERAIVTEIAGTTRDLLEEGLVVHGMPVRLIDAAGIRQSDDPIERAGVERAQNRLKTVDLALVLIDGSIVLNESDLENISTCRQQDRPFLLVVTKGDKDQQLVLPEHLDEIAIQVSSKTGEGLDRLRDSIFNSLVDSSVRADNSITITNQRHRDAAMNSCISLERFISGLDDAQSLDFLAFDLREALSFLGEITGETTADDILDSIFAKFCIGK